MFSLLISFCLDDFCEIKESLVEDLYNINAYDIIMGYLNNHRQSFILKKVMNPLIQKLAMLKNKDEIKKNLLDLLEKCENYTKTCKDNVEDMRDKVQDWYGEINPFLKHSEFGKFLKDNNCHKIMLKTLQEEYSQNPDNLLKLGMIVDHGELVSFVHDMSYGVYNSPNNISDKVDQLTAVRMLNNAIGNWKEDLKIVGNALRLAEAI